MMWTIALLAKATLVLALAAALMQMLRRTLAAVRHALCVVAMTAVLVLPVLVAVIPAWRVAVLPPATSFPGVFTADTPLQSADIQNGPVAGTLVLDDTSSAQPARDVPYALLLWLAGFAAVSAWLLAGRMVLARVRRRAVPVDGAWSHALSVERARLGVAAPVNLLFSSEVTAPLTWGAVQPTIVLPSEALEWNAERQHVVLRHELAHILRRDALTQLLAGLTCALYWFHPGVWWLSRRLRVERETACDDIVLAGGVNGASYAHHLLDVARSARTLNATNMVSIAMASPSSFERRLLSVLDDATPRARRTLPRAAIPFAAVALLLVAAFTPVSRALPVMPAAPVQPPQVPTQQATPEQLDVKAEHTEAALSILRERLDNFGVAPLDTTVRFRVAEGGTLYLTLNTGGDIEVRGADDGMVTVTAALQGSETDLRLESVARGVQVWSGLRGGQQTSRTSHRFVITMPRKYNIRIESAGGDVNIQDVEGNISGTTGGGRVDIQRVRGRIQLATGGGVIRVSDSQASGLVETGAGEVLISNVAGGLRGSSGSGDVTYSNSNVDLMLFDVKNGKSITAENADVKRREVVTLRDDAAKKMEAARADRAKQVQGTLDLRNGKLNKAGGSITLDRARPGSYVTGGGNVIVDETESGVTLGTGGGNVRVGAARGTLVTHTGAGDIEIRVQPDATETLDISAMTGHGNVLLILPADVSARLELDATYTNAERPADIESDFALTVAKPLDWDRSMGSPRRHVRGTAVLGGGAGVIRVTTVNGNIVVRRER